MANSATRYLIENIGANEPTLSTGLQEAFEVCKRDNISMITLVMETKKSFQDSALANLLGANASLALAAGKTLPSGQIKIKLETTKTLSPNIPYGMIIGVYVGKNGMDAIDAVISAKAIVLVPWNEGEGKRWMSTWSPTVLGKSTWAALPIGISADAEAALVQLTKAINLSTGLSHKSDKEYAKRTFETLKSAGKAPKASEVRKWSLRNGWQPKHADDLEKLAKRYRP